MYKNTAENSANGVNSIAKFALRSLKKLNKYNPHPMSSATLLFCLINNDKELTEAFKNEKIDIIRRGYH